MPIIHRACAYGELDTLTDLIELKGVDPCSVADSQDLVSIDKN